MSQSLQSSEFLGHSDQNLSDFIASGAVKEKKHIFGTVTCKDDFYYKLKGRVALQSLYDSRQFRGNYQDYYLIIPLPADCSKCCLDINDKSQYTMIGFEAYFGGKAYGPKVWNAKTYAELEAKFTGVGDSTVRLFRLNKGDVRFHWERSKLMLGHYYHPIGRYKLLNGVKFFPYTLVSSYGAGFDPFTYVPQVRFVHCINNIEYAFALTKHYRSEAARLAVMPDMFFQISGLIRDSHVLGAGINYHVEIPRLVTDKDYKTTEQIGSITAYALASLKFRPFVLNTRVVYAENGDIFNLIGSYAVGRRIPATDERFLVNLRTLNYWFDFTYERKKSELSLFIGYSKNLGARCRIVKSYKDEYDNDIPLLDVPGAITDVDHLLIAAPRVRVHWGPLEIGAGIEYFRAAYAKRRFDEKDWEKDYDCRGRVINTCPVNNMRFIAVTRYFF